MRTVCAAPGLRLSLLGRSSSWAHYDSSSELPLLSPPLVPGPPRPGKLPSPARGLKLPGMR